MKTLYNDIRRSIAELLFAKELDEDFALGLKFGTEQGHHAAVHRLMGQVMKENASAKPSKTRIKYLEEVIEFLGDHK